MTVCKHVLSKVNVSTNGEPNMRSCLHSTSLRYRALFAVLAVQLAATACTPTVKVAADEPITINLNVNIQHEVRVKVEDDLDDLLSDDSGLF